MRLLPDRLPRKRRSFWQQYLSVIGIDAVAVVIGALLLGNLRQISNLFFISTIVLLIIAVIPIFSEIGSSAKIAGRAIREGEKVNLILKEKQSVYAHGARITYLYGLSGMTTFILSIITLIIG
jgi:hypothetical protein